MRTTNEFYLPHCSVMRDWRVYSTPRCSGYGHTLNTGHQCSMKDVNILDHEKNWHRRKIKEANNIHREKPTLNRDVGQELPPVLLQLVSHDIGRVSLIKTLKLIYHTKMEKTEYI